MSAARTSSPRNLKLLPDLAEAAAKLPERYGLPFSTVIASLVWSDAIRPNRSLRALERSASKMVRRPVPCSLREPHLQLARDCADRQQLSVNAYLEALIEAHVNKGVVSLEVLPRSE